jgi:quercetin dioxygenase-like cupin family protein
MSDLHTCQEGSEFSSDNLHYRKVYLYDKANSVVPHSHPFSHDMILYLGKVIVTLGVDEFTLEIGDILTVPANVEHSVRMCPCVEVAEFLCVWPKSTLSHQETTRSD